MSLLLRANPVRLKDGRALSTIVTQRHRHSSTRSNLFTVAEEVQDALATRKPVVALESTIYTHGYPYPENVALASHLESLVRINGGVPATIGIVDGKAHVGMMPETLIRLISTAGSKDTWKISRRDLGFIGGMGLRGKNIHGGTTIAGTMILAHLAGIKIFATGGLGGVHRGGENTMDISADLTELGRTPVAVISSGCKSFLDIPRTLEYLETQGVGVGTFADGRPGSVDFPAFWSRDSGFRSPQTIENEVDAAAIVHAQFSLPVHSGLLLANPVPEEAAMVKSEIDNVIAQAVTEANEQGIVGSANTPFILKRIREVSHGASVVANRALIEANVIRGTRVAVELAKLEIQQDGSALHGQVTRTPVLPSWNQSSISTPSMSGNAAHSQLAQEPAKILVAGSLACDTMCDYNPFTASDSFSSPVLHTSNPAQIAQSAGGVGRNVALAALYAGASVTFTSVVADDIAGYSLVEQVRNSGLSPAFIRQLETSTGSRTAHYVAVNDKKKDLMVAMADMSIFDSPELQDGGYWNAMMDKVRPQWLVVDGNWSPAILSSVISAAISRTVSVAFEPVSTAKAARIFDKQNTAMSSASVVPNHILNLATPNVYELEAMHRAAQRAGLLETEDWWMVINSFGLSGSGSRDKFSSIVGVDLVDRGVPQQAVQLLPFIPSILTKLGAQGVLLTSLLKQGDERLRHPSYAPYIIARNPSDQSEVGGLYMRLFPPAESIQQADIVSVNGVGDTLLGVLSAGLVQQNPGTTRIEDCVQRAQQAAVLTLRSTEAVATEIKGISNMSKG